MAEKHVSNTRIYLDTRRLLDEILDVTEQFPKYHKYSIGTKCHEHCITMLHCVARAYLNKDRDIRIGALSEFQCEYETLKTLVRVAGERKWIKGKGWHARIVELMESIQKQSAAWKNSLVKAKE